MGISVLRLALIVSMVTYCQGGVILNWIEYKHKEDIAKQEKDVPKQEKDVPKQEKDEYIRNFLSTVLGPAPVSDGGNGDGGYDEVNPMGTSRTEAELVYEWTAVEYDFQCPDLREYLMDTGEYDREASMISGIGVYEDEVYITVPKAKSVRGVPSGLNKVVTKGGKSLLQPFPNFKWQRAKECSALQLPTTMEIDPNTGYMYVIDAGRAGILAPNPGNFCPAKIVVFDLKNNGSLVRSHNFPNHVVSRNSNFLDDLVLDYVTPEGKEVRYAYITDTGTASLIVFDFSSNSSWAFKDDSMKTDENRKIQINGVTYSMEIPINGIAMSPNFDYVYYTAIGSKKLFQIATSALRDEYSDFGRHLRDLGNKVGNSDGMASGQKSIFYGVINANAIYSWNRTKDLAWQGVSEGRVALIHEQELTSNNVTMQWPDGLTLDTKGYLWFTTERAPLFFSNTMDFSGGQGANFRIFKMYVGDVSYLVKPKH